MGTSTSKSVTLDSAASPSGAVAIQYGYKGETSDSTGQRHGYGTYVYRDDGSEYNGNYKNDLRHGIGTMMLTNGIRYEGEWRHGYAHGQGLLTFPDGDQYSGGWHLGKKHGHGWYRIAENSEEIVGEWHHGKCVVGVVHDKRTDTDADLESVVGEPDEEEYTGTGSVTPISQHHLEQMNSDVTFPVEDDVTLKPHKEHTAVVMMKRLRANNAADAKDGDGDGSAQTLVPLQHEDVEKKQLSLYHQYSHQIERAVLKTDHFQGIYKLERLVDGAPNFRKVEGYPVFGVGQPTSKGFTELCRHVAVNHNISKVIWTCMRQEPVVYVNNGSYAPRAITNLNENMHLVGIEPSLVEELQTLLAHRVRDHGVAIGKFEYYQDTYAENPADRKNLLLEEKIDSINDVRSLTTVYDALRDKHGFDVVYHRMPIADEKAPQPHDFDLFIHALLGKMDEKTGMFFNCQMGKGRTTTGMVCAILMYRSTHEESFELKATEPITAETPTDERRRRGHYQVIDALVEALPNGLQIKNELDDAIDRASHLQNLRLCIEHAKTMYDKETVDRRQFWKNMSVNFIERYFYLIAFNAYLHEASKNEFNVTFEQWHKDHADLFAILGTRDSGALSTFDWN
jgi:hypothetical protein